MAKPGGGSGTDELYCHLSSRDLAELIQGAEHQVCFVAPGIQMEPASAMAAVAKRIGSDRLAVVLDFGEHVFRMGWGKLEAVEELRKAGIRIGDALGLRSGLVIVDLEGYSYTPTAELLESESRSGLNALRLSPGQVRHLVGRLVSVSSDDAGNEVRVVDLPGETREVVEEQFKEVKLRLEEAPPVKFDVARQVNVFSPYLQFVELSLRGARVDRKRYAIPRTLTEVGRFRDLDGRMKTTFDLIAEESRNTVSAHEIEAQLECIRDEYTRALPREIGKGRVFLKARKAEMKARIRDLGKDLDMHQNRLEGVPAGILDDSRWRVIQYYERLVSRSPPHGLRLQCGDALRSADVQLWIGGCLSNFPSVDSVVQKMKLHVDYKDVTYETLTNEGFVDWVAGAFPDVDGDRPFHEVKAAKER